MKFIMIYVLYFATTAYCMISDNFVGKVFVASWPQSEDNYENIIVSPLSLVAPLGTLALASHGQTHKEVLHALDVIKTKQISQSYNEAMNELFENNHTEIITANRVYLSQDLEINPDFFEHSKHDFDIEVVNVNFKHEVKTAEVINRWVEKQTHNVIKNLVSPKSITQDTCVMLINTIYFEAKWSKQFQESREREFHVNKHTKLSAPYMNVESYLPYLKSNVLNAEILLIPYRKSKCSFMIIYPNINVDIHSMRNKFRDRGVLGDVTKDMKMTNINLYMPKFKFENLIDLKEVLQKLNIKEIFSDNANLSKMVLNLGNDDLYLNNAYQKAFIRVNEEGTQAAAANVFQMLKSSMAKHEPPREVVINRPFYFEIGCSKTTVFSGILFRPELN